jgi:endonuclease III
MSAAQSVPWEVGRSPHLNRPARRGTLEIMIRFDDLIARLLLHYGEPALPPASGPFELVLWENACYLLPDERRAAVFALLRERVGLSADAIAKAGDAVLLPIAKLGGMRSETRVFRWREIARIVLTQFEGDLSKILAGSYAAAKKALKQFPNIGDPGAEKILMLCGMAEGLPLESNGLRVLTRVGFGRAQKSYGAMYRSAQDALAGQVPSGAAAVARAHLLLREHGKTLCKTNGPLCAACPVCEVCNHGRTTIRSPS